MTDQKPDWADKRASEIIDDCGLGGCICDGGYSLKRVGHTIAQALRQARNEALDEAIKACDAIGVEDWQEWKKDPKTNVDALAGSNTAVDCVNAIRALKSGDK